MLLKHFHMQPVEYRSKFYDLVLRYKVIFVVYRYTAKLIVAYWLLQGGRK